jgi:hypothetical protein
MKIAPENHVTSLAACVEAYLTRVVPRVQ